MFYGLIQTMESPFSVPFELQVNAPLSVNGQYIGHWKFHLLSVQMQVEKKINSSKTAADTQS